MKLMILLIALSLFFLLSKVAQTSKQQETPQAVIQRQDFFKDLKHLIMTGNWIYKIYEFDTFRKYPQNSTCFRYDTFRTKPLGLMTRVATTSRACDSIVAIATHVWNVTDAAAKFYGGYLDRFVKHVEALVIAMTWQDVFYMMSIDLVLSFFLHAVYLLVSFAMNFIRRQWLTYKDSKDKRSAANLPAANLPPAPKKPILQPKPKKKKRRNENTW